MSALRLCTLGMITLNGTQCLKGRLGDLEVIVIRLPEAEVEASGETHQLLVAQPERPASRPSAPQHRARPRTADGRSRYRPSRARGQGR